MPPDLHGRRRGEEAWGEHGKCYFPLCRRNTRAEELNHTLTLRATTKLLKQSQISRSLKQSQKATSQYGLYLLSLNATPAHLSPPLIEGSRHRALLWAGRPRGHLSAKPCDYDTKFSSIGLAAAARY